MPRHMGYTCMISRANCREEPVEEGSGLWQVPFYRTRRIHMRSVSKILFLTLILTCTASSAAWSASPQSPPGAARKQVQAKEGMMVGRISLVEGELLRYVPEEKDWVQTVKDSPFGLEDALYSGENSKSEFLMPNSTWLRIGASTQIQMIALKEDATEVDVASGMARFIDRSSTTVIKATTPYGYVVGEPGSAFDLYVGDESVEVIGIRGKVDFIHDVDGAKYDVIPGSISILADNRQATAGEGKVDSEWDDWNGSRDSMLAQNIETKGESVNYLPEGIREDSRVLDENGRWERVYYEGQYRQVWRPTTVEADWAPYTAGRWTNWYGDNCWIPYEPFGYVTHHYGYWFSANNYWYWAPPVVSVRVGAPYLGIGFGWYPGRVGWMYSGVNVGWFPLLPWEPYYARRWWGPWGFTVSNPALISINLGRYRFYNHATVVPYGHFYGVNGYRSVRVTNINNTTIINNFRATPVVGTHVLGATNVSRQYSFTDRGPGFRPNQTVTSRVTQNQTRFSQTSATVNRRSIQQQASTARLGRPAAGASVNAPRMSAGGSGTQGQFRSLNQNPRAVQHTNTTVSSPQGRGGATQGRVSGMGRGATSQGRISESSSTSGRGRASSSIQATGRSSGQGGNSFRSGGRSGTTSETSMGGSRGSRNSTMSGRGEMSTGRGQSYGRQGSSQQYRGSMGGRSSGFERNSMGRSGQMQGGRSGQVMQGRSGMSGGGRSMGGASFQRGGGGGGGRSMGGAPSFQGRSGGGGGGGHQNQMRGGQPGGGGHREGR